MKLAFVASDSPKAQTALKDLTAMYGNVDFEDAETVIALGGDGFMLQTLYKCIKSGKSVYGMNRGTLGFLMNKYKEEGLIERIESSISTPLRPLRMITTDKNGKKEDHMAINEASLFRQTRQSSHFRISINGVVRMEKLVADGVLVSTPAGSTAYNFSVYGPVLPLDSEILALTPISPFRPRRWRGALLPTDVTVDIEVLNTDKRPTAAVADNIEIRDVVHVKVYADKEHRPIMLCDKDQGLEERIVKEQFFS
ncbi:MAG: NAD kinase [Alphaproteobacteria bacterium]